MLVDLDRLVHPRLYVMDGITAMEGNGPRGGTPRKLNVLLFSADPIAIDATVCRLIDLDPLLVPTIALGQAAGRGTCRAGEHPPCSATTLTHSAAAILSSIERRSSPTGRRALLRFASNRLVAKPVITESACVRCGLCITVCPAKPKAVDWRRGDRTRPPVHDYGRCIRCYCCQELCPEGDRAEKAAAAEAAQLLGFGGPTAALAPLPLGVVLARSGFPPVPVFGPLLTRGPHSPPPAQHPPPQPAPRVSSSVGGNAASRARAASAAWAPETINPQRPTRWPEAWKCIRVQFPRHGGDASFAEDLRQLLDVALLVGGGDERRHVYPVRLGAGKDLLPRRASS